MCSFFFQDLDVISADLRNETKIEGQNVTLWCDMEGKPLASVTWKKGGRVLSNADRITIINPTAVGRANSTLTITGVERGDEGLYTCTVNNSVGTVSSRSSSGYLTVNCKY